MTHRQIIKQWLSGIHLDRQIVSDWGSGSKPVFRYIKHENCRFLTIDNAPGIPDDRRGTYHFEYDISQPIPTFFQADVAFCLEVLEHVEEPAILLQNISNHLEMGGLLYLSAPFKYDIHADVDYWRFTANGLRLLLENAGFEVLSIKETIDELGYMVEARKW